jgi:hypothetical protein
MRAGKWIGSWCGPFVPDAVPKAEGLFRAEHFQVRKTGPDGCRCQVRQIESEDARKKKGKLLAVSVQ